MNDRPFQKREGTRRSEFMAHDRPAIRPLPAVPFTVRQWRQTKVHIDYHVSVEKVWYSVHYKYVGRTVQVRLTDTILQCIKGDIIPAIKSQIHTKRPQTVHLPNAPRLFRLPSA